MECAYAEVKQHRAIDEKIAWKYFWRQLYVSAGAWLLYFLCGLSFGLPTVLIPQLRREANSTEAVSPEMASWLSSVFGYSALPWVVIICLFTKRYGRKLPIVFVCLNTSAYYAVLYFSTTTTEILIAEIMQGVNHATNMTLSVIIVSEYTSPKCRGIFLAIKSATIFWGIWVANAMGTFFYWKYIPLLGFGLSFFNISVLFWPESPQWLASKGKFEECRKSHRWLRGLDKTSEKELESLIQSQCDNKHRQNNWIKCALRTLCKRTFYKPLILSVVMIMQYHLSGKLVCMVYAIDIIKKITANESTAYLGMLILDGVTIVGMYLGCALSRVLKRRTLLISSCAIGISFLYVLSLYLFLIESQLIAERKLVTLVLLICFSVSISCGPMILSTSIYGELIPLKYKSSCTMISAFVFVILTSTLLKIFPYVSYNFNMSGAFVFYAVSSTFCAVYTYLYLPETKDKTLQEIEDLFKAKTIGKENMVSVEKMLVGAGK